MRNALRTPVKKSDAFIGFGTVLAMVSLGACAKIDRPYVNAAPSKTSVSEQKERVESSVPQPFSGPTVEYYPQLRALFSGRTESAHAYALRAVRSWVNARSENRQELLRRNRDFDLRFKRGVYRPDKDLESLLALYQANEPSSWSDTILSLFYFSFACGMDPFVSFPPDFSIFDAGKDWVEQVEALDPSHSQENFNVLDFRSMAGTDSDRLGWALSQIEKHSKPLVIWTDEMTRGTAEIFAAKLARRPNVLIVGSRTMGYAHTFCEVSMPWDPSMKMGRGCQDLEGSDLLPLSPTLTLPVSPETLQERSRLKKLAIPVKTFGWRSKFPDWLSVSTRRELLKGGAQGSLELVKQVATEWTSSFAK